LFFPGYCDKLMPWKYEIQERAIGYPRGRGSFFRVSLLPKAMKNDDKSGK